MPLKTWQIPLRTELWDKLQQHNVVLNAASTGVGKTYLVADIVTEDSVPSVFVICPKSVLSAWKMVLTEFGVADKVQGILNWEKLQRRKTKYYDVAGWHLPANTLVVIDEAHKGASGPDTITTKMMAQLKAYKFPVIIQSATLADSPLKLRAAGFLLGLHGFERSSFYRWCRAYGCYQSPFHAGLDFPKGLRGKEQMVKMHGEIKDRLVKCALEDIPGFPECETTANLYDLDTQYTKEVNEIYSAMEAKLKEPNVNPMVEKLRARQRVELYKVPLLVDLIEESLEEDKSVVLFTSFRETLARVGEALTKAGTAYASIYGGQKPEERDAALADFQSNKKHVILVMIQAGSAGISLHDVLHQRPRVAYICPSYSAVDVKQALGRIHRVGGTKALNAFVLAAGTVEEKIKRAIDGKLDNIGALNGTLTDEDLA